MKFVITAGPTREFIDPVRFLSNPSTGKMGFALARAAAKRGHDVILVAGPVALKTPKGVRRVDVVSARDMLAAVEEALGLGRAGCPPLQVGTSARGRAGCPPLQVGTSARGRAGCPPLQGCASPLGGEGTLPSRPDTVLISTAAVADWRPASCAASKLKKHQMSGVLKLVRNPDILKTVDGVRKIGFAAETDDVLAEAARKCREKKLEMIVANDVGEKGCGFGTDTNRVTFVRPDGSVERLPLMSKLAVAGRIVRAIEKGQTR